jgi:heme A synthase
MTYPTSAKPRRPRPKRFTWSAHILTLAVLLLVYLAGYSGGRDAAPLSRAANHPACHPNLKP